MGRRSQGQLQNTSDSASPTLKGGGLKGIVLTVASEARLDSPNFESSVCLAETIGYLIDIFVLKPDIPDGGKHRYKTSQDLARSRGSPFLFKLVDINQFREESEVYPLSIPRAM